MRVTKNNKKQKLGWSSPLHRSAEQDSTMTSLPWQGRPPLLGGGSLQDLLLTLEQSGPHADHEDQVDHLPSTAVYNATGRSWKSWLNCDYLICETAKEWIHLRISIGARVCSTLKRLVHVNTGTVFALIRILLQFATHYYNLLHIILSGAWVSLCSSPTGTGRIAFYSLCGWPWARLTAVDWNGICTCSCPLLYASTTACAALWPSGPGRPPAVHWEWIGKRKKRIHWQN